MSNYTDNLRYSLAKRIPDMERGFGIDTEYGRIDIAADHAAPIIRMVRIALEKDLAYAERQRVAA
ncbi:MAG: hypothetical protein A2143_02265 [Gallionellales bacterium RBG_16_57_15]|nr:MAG: hypothetical protein A2143_02265 [Gallionellales bacterium RBG_16_57_15]